MDFCARHWGATPKTISPTLVGASFEQAFDLIWCGSVLTHLDQTNWEKTLDFLIDNTAECGVLIITLQGRYFATSLANEQKFVADDVDQKTLLEDFKQNGFAYQPYFHCGEADYGISLNSPQWVMRHLEQRTDIIVRGYIEEAWGMQDVLILYKTKNYFATVT